MSKPLRKIVCQRWKVIKYNDTSKLCPLAMVNLSSILAVISLRALLVSFNMIINRENQCPILHSMTQA